MQSLRQGGKIGKKQKRALLKAEYKNQGARYKKVKGDKRQSSRKKRNKKEKKRKKEKQRKRQCANQTWKTQNQNIPKGDLKLAET